MQEMGNIDVEIYEQLVRFRLRTKVAVACFVHPNTVYNVLALGLESPSKERIRQTAAAAVLRAKEKEEAATKAAIETVESL